MKMATGYRISKRGWRVTLRYDDGSEASVDFENFKRAFGDHRRAVLEYMMYVTVMSRNEDVARRIRRELSDLLLPRPE